MYEDWDERARDCIKPEHIEKIQAVLDEAFKGGYETEYWTYVNPVEIDIRPTPVQPAVDPNAILEKNGIDPTGWTWYTPAPKEGDTE
ncbi:hypothetical protein D3C71_1867810 [compost metagenome]